MSIMWAVSLTGRWSRQMLGYFSEGPQDRHFHHVGCQPYTGRWSCEMSVYFSEGLQDRHLV